MLSMQQCAVAIMMPHLQPMHLLVWQVSEATKQSTAASLMIETVLRYSMCNTSGHIGVHTYVKRKQIGMLTH